ncbi:MAG TPA: carbamoyl phosphate synthase small subunit [Verrucomicrobia bacterium]|nr:carbamoyl phosphate synthase small subunit [Verrucomicrobiota bacterium]
MENAYAEKWAAERERRAFLALADGTVFHGVAFGAPVDKVGEVVFNTGMSGYQEILTDPSYAGQFVTLTTAEVGDYGTNPEDVESRALFLSGLLVNDLTEPSNWRSTKSLDAYLKEAGVPGLRALDTRHLTLHLREHGNQKAYLHVSDEPVDEAEGIRRAQAWEGLDGQDYASKVSCTVPYEVACRTASGAAPLVVCYDFGVKTNILRSLADFARVWVVPSRTSAAEVLAQKPAGVFLSNGPADPAAVTYAIENVKALLGKVPLMGICLGHQLLSLACGARTGRLKFGHHGCNHPVRNLATGKVEITSQNHNFAVLPETVPDCLEVTHVNLNDNTIEGVRHKTLPAFSVQYHPEACPGPRDSAYLFAAFRDMIQGKGL